MSNGVLHFARTTPWSAAIPEAIKNRWPTPFSMNGTVVSIIYENSPNSNLLSTVVHKDFPNDPFDVSKGWLIIVEDYDRLQNDEIVADINVTAWGYENETSLSKEFLQKYPTPDKINGKVLVFKSVHGYNATAYNVIMPEFPNDVFTIHKSFIRFVNKKAEVGKCDCRIMVTGCICGVFKKEMEKKRVLSN